MSQALLRFIARLAMRLERRVRAFSHDYRLGPGDFARAAIWNYMKTNLNRATAAGRKPRTQPYSRAVTPPPRTE